MGLAARPGTEVLPTCSMATTMSPRADRTRSSKALNRAGQEGSYSTMTTGARTADLPRVRVTPPERVPLPLPAPFVGRGEPARPRALPRGGG